MGERCNKKYKQPKTIKELYKKEIIRILQTEKLIALIQSLISLGAIYGIIKTRVELIENKIKGLSDLSERVTRLEEKINFIISKLKEK
jgi:hypothetical protein